jgi:GxxExxY protein
MSLPYLKYHEITEQIIGAAMKVHRYFGPGFPEIIYKRALIIEIEKIPLPLASEIEKEIIYDQRLIGKRRLDLIIADKILVELKATTEIDNSCFAQIINYLRVFNVEVGLLINFGTSSLKFKRFINTKQSVKSI